LTLWAETLTNGNDSNPATTMAGTFMDNSLRGESTSA
jgi:hypothetical protein